MSDPAPAPDTSIEPHVVDDVDSSRFRYVGTGHEQEARLEYRAEDGRLDLHHTEVPDELGGRGVGGQLVRAAVERAAGSGETVVPTCPFVRSWLEKHPDEAATITIDWP
jgi:predicted GNAT family acetyltransferase